MTIIYSHYGITPTYFRGTNSCILVFDITQKSSFDDLGEWIRMLQENGNIPFLLIGNKTDLPGRAVDFQEATEFAETNNVQYFETSAVSGLGVEEAFAGAISLAVSNTQNYNNSTEINVQNNQNNNGQNASNSVTIENSSTENKKCSC